MKHLRKFNTQTERDEFMANTPLPDYPYVHYLADSKSVIYSDAEVDIPFYIENIEGLSLKFGNSYEYSRDGVTWTSGTSSTTISYTTPGERVYFRASGLTASSSAGIGAFTISAGTCNIGGNLMSMLYGADYRGQTEITQGYAFYKMFDGETRIKSARFLALPATTLASSCYSNMFNGCTSLVNAPALPATTISSNSYSYNYMFYGCTSLSYIKVMCSGIQDNTVTNWVKGVATEGTFVKRTGAAWDSGNSGIPEGWTVETADA